MKTLRTLVLGLNTLLLPVLPACSHNAGHAKPTITAITSKASGLFTAEELAKLDEITNRAHECGDEFRLCKKTKPEYTCKKKMGACSDKIKRDYNLQDKDEQTRL